MLYYLSPTSVDAVLVRAQFISTPEGSADYDKNYFDVFILHVLIIDHVLHFCTHLFYEHFTIL